MEGSCPGLGENKPRPGTCHGAGGCRGLAKGEMPCSSTRGPGPLYGWHLRLHPGGQPGRPERGSAGAQREGREAGLGLLPAQPGNLGRRVPGTEDNSEGDSDLGRGPVWSPGLRGGPVTIWPSCLGLWPSLYQHQSPKALLSWACPVPTLPFDL